MEHIEGEVVIEMVDYETFSYNDIDAASTLLTLMETDDPLQHSATTEDVTAALEGHHFAPQQLSYEEHDLFPDITEADLPEESLSQESMCENITVAKLKEINKKSMKIRGKINYDRERNQLLRQAGKEYQSLKKDALGKYVKVTKPHREMGPICESDFCQRSINRHCHIASDDKRKIIFNSFWKMSWPEKRFFIKASTDFVHVKQARICATQPRNKQNQYFLRIDGKRLQVCCKTFVATLGIKDKMLRNCLNESLFIYSNLGFLNKKVPKKQCIKFIKAKNFAERILDKLPKLPSHFARAESDKVFLQGDFDSIRSVHR